MTFAIDNLRFRQLAGFSGSRARDGNDTQTIKWIVLGADDADEAEAKLIAEGFPEPVIDFTPPGGPAKTLRLQDYAWEEAVEGNETAYVFTASYSFEKLDVDEWTFSVSTAGGTIRMTNSLATSSYGDAPDFDGAIDVKDGKAQGVDRIIPVIRYTLNYRMTRPADPIAFSNLAADLTGTTNSNSYLGCQPGELLFLGMDGNFGNQINPEIQFSWAKSKNATLSIGEIANVAKKGHDYLWVLYEEQQTGSGASAFISTKARAAFVEKIYEEADHSTLGLLLS